MSAFRYFTRIDCRESESERLLSDSSVSVKLSGSEDDSSWMRCSLSLSRLSLSMDSQSSWNIWMRSFKVYGKWSVQARKHTQACAQWSHTSLGLAQARPNYIHPSTWHKHCVRSWSWWLVLASLLGYTSCTVPYNMSPLRHVTLLSYVV